MCRHNVSNFLITEMLTSLLTTSNGCSPTVSTYEGKLRIFRSSFKYYNYSLLQAFMQRSRTFKENFIMNVHFSKSSPSSWKYGML